MSAANGLGQRHSAALAAFDESLLGRVAERLQQAGAVGATVEELAEVCPLHLVRASVGGLVLRGYSIECRLPASAYTQGLAPWQPARYVLLNTPVALEVAA